MKIGTLRCQHGCEIAGYVELQDQYRCEKHGESMGPAYPVAPPGEFRGLAPRAPPTDGPELIVSDFSKEAGMFDGPEWITIWIDQRAMEDELNDIAAELALPEDEMERLLIQFELMGGELEMFPDLGAIPVRAKLAALKRAGRTYDYVTACMAIDQAVPGWEEREDARIRAEFGDDPDFQDPTEPLTP